MHLLFEFSSKVRFSAEQPVRSFGGLNPVLGLAAKPDRVTFHMLPSARLRLLVAFRSHNLVWSAFIRMSVRLSQEFILEAILTSVSVLL